jgi:hypothetical protein
LEFGIAIETEIEMNNRIEIWIDSSFWLVIGMETGTGTNSVKIKTIILWKGNINKLKSIWILNKTW